MDLCIESGWQTVNFLNWWQSLKHIWNWVVSLLNLLKVPKGCWVYLHIRCISAYGLTHLLCQHTRVCARVCVFEIETKCSARAVVWVCSEMTTLYPYYRTDLEALTVSIISPCIASAELLVNRAQQTINVLHNIHKKEGPIIINCVCISS